MQMHAMVVATVDTSRSGAGLWEGHTGPSSIDGPATWNDAIIVAGSEWLFSFLWLGFLLLNLIS